MTGKIVSKMVNKAVFQVDWKSFRRTKTAIRSLRKEFKTLRNQSIRIANTTEAKSVAKEMAAQKAITKEKQKQSKADDKRRAKEKKHRQYLNRLTYSVHQRAAKATLKRNALQDRQRSTVVNRVQTGQNRVQQQLMYSRNLKPAQLKRYNADLAATVGMFTAGNITASQFSNNISNITRNIRHTNDATKSWWKSMDNVRKTMIAATAAGTVFFAGMAMVNTGKEMDAMRVGMKAVFGDKARQQMEYVINTANQYGTEIRSISKDYTKFSAASTAAGVSMADQRFNFESLLTASRAFGLTGEQVKLSIRLISRLMSKYILNNYVNCWDTSIKRQSAAKVCITNKVQRLSKSHL